jgi:hypothetical protein
MAPAMHWLRPGNTTQYLCRSNLAASCDCYVALCLFGQLPLSRTAITESRIFSMPYRYCLSAVIIEPQLRLLRTLRGLIVYPDYRAIIVHVAFITKACCVVVALIAAHALTPDTLELVLAWIVVSCSRPWSHIMHNLPIFFVWLYILFDCVVWHHIFIYIAKWP